MQYCAYYKRLLFIFFTVAFFSQQVKAQYNEKDFVCYTVKDGLSDNYITCLQQDHLGYMWAGTESGLNRFDGNTFRIFYQGSDVLPLLSGSILKMKQVNNKELGILTASGFQLLDPKKYSLKNFVIPDTTGFTTQRNWPWDAVEFADHSLALTTAAGFYVFKKPGEIIKSHEVYKQEDVGKKRILFGREIYPLNTKQNLVFVEANGLMNYNAETNSFTQIDSTDKDWHAFRQYGLEVIADWKVKIQINSHQFIFIPHKANKIIFYDHTAKRTVISNTSINALLEFDWRSNISMMNDSVFAINSSVNGFYIFTLNKTTGQIQFNPEKLLPSQKITCLYFDKDNSLWAGTFKGLLHQKLIAPFIQSFHLPARPGQQVVDMATCTYRYKDKLYVGLFSQREGIMIMNANSMKVEKHIAFFGDLVHPNGINEVRSIEMYYKDTLWIGTNGGLLWFDTKTEHYGKVMDNKLHIPLSVLAPARSDGYAWMCNLLGGLVARYHIKSRVFTLFTSASTPALPFDKIKSIVYDSYGDVWIGGHSLTRWNNKKQLFDTLITVYGGANKFNDNILTLTADNDGSLWFHNADNGLLEYKINEKKYVAYTTKDGLPHEQIQTLSPVINGILWIGFNSHLVRLDTRTKKAVLYDAHDGLPEPKPTGRRMYYDTLAGKLYMCNNEYLSGFSWQEMKSIDKGSELLIEEVIVNNQQSYQQPGMDLKLKPGQNNLRINFTIIDFEKSNYQFAYKLNKEESWNNLGLQRSINLNNLPPGKYLLQVKATGKTGDEKFKELTIIIAPPYWKTTWFRILCIVLVVVTTYFIYRNRIRHIHQKADIDKLLAQTEMKALHAQMNPHFIFNSLNSIQEMILNNENKDASHFLSKFAHLIRITLDQSSQAFISLRNTVDYLNRYIQMEQIRKNNFACTINVGQELDPDETLLPPMLIQPFIENAIWHGASEDHRDLFIKVYFEREDDNLVCRIEDDGIGIDHSLKNKPASAVNHQSVAIANIKNRIQLLNEKYHLHCSIDIMDKKNINDNGTTGTLVILKLPFEIKEV